MSWLLLQESPAHRGEAAGSGVSWPYPHCLCSREAKSDGHVACSFSSFHSVQGPRSWDGTAHPGVGLPTPTNLMM